MTTLHTLALLSILSLLAAPSSSKVSISVAPRSVSKSGNPVTIKWSGLDSPSHLDWLGIYTPMNSAHRHFIGYISSPCRPVGSLGRAPSRSHSSTCDLITSSGSSTGLNPRSTRTRWTTTTTRSRGPSTSSRSPTR